MKLLNLSRGLFLVTSLVAMGGDALAQRAAAAAPRVAAPAGASQLRFRYTQGARLNYTTTAVQSQQLPGAAAPQRITTSATVSIETARVNADGSAEQRMRVGGLTMSGGGIPAAAAQQISQGLSGMTLSYTQNTRGQITARQPVQGVSPQFQPILDGILQSIDQMAPAFPEGPVAIGATWSEHKNMHMALGPASMDLSIDVTYTLRSVAPAANGGTAVLAMSMRMAFPNAVVIQGASLTGGGTATGTLTVDLGKGGITNSTSTGSMNMQVTARGQTVPITSTFNNTMSLTP